MVKYDCTEDSPHVLCPCYESFSRNLISTDAFPNGKGSYEEYIGDRPQKPVAIVRPRCAEPRTFMYILRTCLTDIDGTEDWQSWRRARISRLEPERYAMRLFVSSVGG